MAAEFRKGALFRPWMALALGGLVLVLAFAIQHRLWKPVPATITVIRFHYDADTGQLLSARLSGDAMLSTRPDRAYLLIRRVREWRWRLGPVNFGQRATCDYTLWPRFDPDAANATGSATPGPEARQFALDHASLWLPVVERDGLHLTASEIAGVDPPSAVLRDGLIVFTGGAGAAAILLGLVLLARQNLHKVRQEVRAEQHQCPACGYSVRGLTSPTCPECSSRLGPTP